MRAVQLTAYGNPIEGLQYVNIPEPEAPGPNQVLIGVEFSPVNPSDLLLARGIYGIRPALPTVIGGEGVGRVLAVGAGVENVKVGDRVLAPLSSFTWRERMVVPASDLFALPSGADPRQLSMLAINPPTAALLLSEYFDLKPGEWVVQNAANSSVGRWVIAFAKARGLKTVNIVRRPELVPELQAIGGDVVVVDSPDASEEAKAAVGQAELRLALDGVSGPATGVLASTLSPHGTLVSFAAMSGAAMSISPLEALLLRHPLASYSNGELVPCLKSCGSTGCGSLQSPSLAFIASHSRKHTSHGRMDSAHPDTACSAKPYRLSLGRGRRLRRVAGEPCR